MSARLEEYKLLNVSDISIWESANVRHSEVGEGLDELAASIREVGLLNPILVQDLGNKKYRVIAGQRRFLAVSDYLHWTKIPAVIIKGELDESDARVRSIIENLHRKQVTTEDYALACVALRDRFKDDKKAAKALGISVQTFRSYLGFAGLPRQIQSLANQKVISKSDARRLGELAPNLKQAVEFAERIAKKPKPVRDRYWDALIQSPDAPMPVIDEMAKRSKFRKRFVLHFAEVFARGLIRAADENEEKPEYTAEEVVKRWLKERGYVK